MFALILLIAALPSPGKPCEEYTTDILEIRTKFCVAWGEVQTDYIIWKIRPDTGKYYEFRTYNSTYITYTSLTCNGSSKWLLHIRYGTENDELTDIRIHAKRLFCPPITRCN